MLYSFCDFSFLQKLRLKVHYSRIQDTGTNMSLHSFYFTCRSYLAFPTVGSNELAGVVTQYKQATTHIARRTTIEKKKKKENQIYQLHPLLRSSAQFFVSITFICHRR